MIKARASGSKVYLYFMKKGRQARHRIPRNSCSVFTAILVCILADHRTGAGESGLPQSGKIS